jgi:hypothetical protein
LETDVGIKLQRLIGIGLVLQEFQTALLQETHLFPDMKLLFINGCECTEMLVAEAMLMISSTVGELVIMAARIRVLHFQDNAEDAPPFSAPESLSFNSMVVPDSRSNGAYHTKVVQGSSTESMTSTTALVAGQNTTRQLGPNRQQYGLSPSLLPEKHKAIVVKAVIQKPSQRASVGLTIVDEPMGNGKSVPAISKIDARGLCANTPLKVGMRIRSVNGLQCYSKDDTMVKLKRAKATVYMEAEQQQQSSYLDATEEQETAPLTPPKSWWSRKKYPGPTATTTTTALESSNDHSDSPTLAPAPGGEMA